MEERNDEIDLLELSRNIMVGFYNYTLRRFKLLGIFVIIGGIIGFGLYFKNKDTYMNTIIGTSYIVNPLIIVDIINSLQEINKSDKGAIMGFLNLNSEEAAALSSIEADTIQTIKTTDNQQLTTIKIKIKFKKELNLTDFATALGSYIDSNSYVKQELKLEKQKSLELVRAYTEEISKLDSLQQKILAANLDNSNNPQGNLLVLNDKVNNFFHNDIISLESNKQYQIKRIGRFTGFTILDQNRGTKIKEVSLIGTIVKLMALFFGIGFFVSLVLEFKRNVKHIEQSRKT